MPFIAENEDIPQEFDRYWSAEQDKAFQRIVDEEKLARDKVQALIENYLFSDQEPIRDEILDLLAGDQLFCRVNLLVTGFWQGLRSLLRRL